MQVMRAVDVMNRNLVTIQSNMNARQAGALFVQGTLSKVLVLDSGGQPVGVLSLEQLFGHRARGGQQSPAVTGPLPRRRTRESAFSRDGGDGRHLRDPERRVDEIMTAPVCTVDEQAPLNEVARQMILRRTDRVFVTRADTVVGVVTTTDMLRAYCGARAVESRP